MQSKLISFIVFIISITFSLAAVEVVLRLKNSSMQNYDIEMWRYSKELKKKSSNPTLGHEHIPSSSALLQSVKIRTNEYGLRGGSISLTSKKKRRVLFIGSSITLGWGVDEDKTMTSLLQSRFYEHGKSVEVLNAGIGNYNTVRYVELFLTKLKKIQPSDIVIHYFLNDAEVLQNRDNFLIRQSQLAVTIWSLINRLRSGNVGASYLTQHYNSVYDTGSKGFQEMNKTLKRLSEYARNNDIRIYLAMVPDIHNLVDYKFGFIHRIMEKVSRKLGIDFIDLLPAFTNIKPEKIWSMAGDPHPNAFGHKLMADALYPRLVLQ